MSLTPKQAALLDFLKAQIHRNGYAPSIAEIASHFNLNSFATVHEHLKNLERMGYIRRRPTEARSIEIVDRDVPRSVVDQTITLIQRKCDRQGNVPWGDGVAEFDALADEIRKLAS